MFAWWVILLLVLLNLVLIAASLRFIYYFTHPDDLRYKQGILAQVVAIIGFALTWLILSIIPTDAYNAYFDAELNMLYFWQLVYLALVVYLATVVPVSVAYYEAESDPRITRTSPWIQAARKGGILSGIIWLVVGLAYLICINIKLPELSCTQWEDDKCIEYATEIELVEGKLNFLTYLVALPGFVGWFIFAFQGGVGIAAIPIDLVQSFRNRPKPLSAGQYERHKKVLGERAVALRKIGESLRDKEAKLREKSGLQKSTARLKLRGKVSKYTQVVRLLDNEFDLMETAYHKRGENPIVSWLKLTGGFLTIVLSILIIQQILVTIIIPQIIHGTDIFNILAQAIIGIRKAKTFGLDWFFYVMVTGYLVGAAVCGGIKINKRLSGILPVETLKKEDTHLNSLLFHTSVMIMGACAAVQLSTDLLKPYLVDTEAEALFGAQKYHMNMLSKLYNNNVFVWVFLIVAIGSCAWLIIFPKDRPALNVDDPKVLAKWAKMQKQLGIDEKDPGAVHVPSDIEEEQGQPAAPTLGERAKAKLTRFDKGIEDAPGNLLGAAVRNPFK